MFARSTLPFEYLRALVTSTSSIKSGWLMKIVLKFRTRSPATSPYSRAILVKYSSGLLLSGPSDHRLNPSEGPAGNFLRRARHIPRCYARVRAASTRRACGKQSDSSRAEGPDSKAAAPEIESHL